MYYISHGWGHDRKTLVAKLLSPTARLLTPAPAIPHLTSPQPHFSSSAPHLSINPLSRLLLSESYIIPCAPNVYRRASESHARARARSDPDDVPLFVRKSGQRRNLL